MSNQLNFRLRNDTSSFKIGAVQRRRQKRRVTLQLKTMKSVRLDCDDHKCVDDDYLMARIKLLFFRTNFWIASLAGEDSSVIRSRSSFRWSILQMIITMPNSIMNEFNTNMHRPNGRKARLQCGKATWNTTLRASRPREAGWIGRGQARGEPRW